VEVGGTPPSSLPTINTHTLEKQKSLSGESIEETTACVVYANEISDAEEMTPILPLYIYIINLNISKPNKWLYC